MPQFRQDFITKEWVIIAPERAKRPDEFRKGRPERPASPRHDPACPFCPGNEAQTPSAVLTLGDGGGWRVRVVPNKFAAVNPALSSKRTEDGRYLSAEGFGIAEVIIESPLHDADITTMPTETVRELLGAYRARYADLAKNPSVDLITIFRNHGRAAGTSLAHPHSQVIATPIVTPLIRNIMQQALLYHDSHGDCPYCVMISQELASRQRIILDSEHFIVYCPYAARAPFETRIIAKHHGSRFDNVSDCQLDELAGLLRATLRKIGTGLGDPDYNLVIHSSPTSDGELHYDHWRLIIVPRITTPAGFELGSGIFINIMPPEDAARFLRETPAE
jgi:UDPglucose--hexose-1-phosphate uridylyltransferase